ncbi:MAG: Crp/Fnr family transcriptional regulator [Desulfobacteraceae bacterium]|nr:Crp/Fnr family transcriptional regulator [Desulfobacteraceae bacterium]
MVTILGPTAVPVMDRTGLILKKIPCFSGLEDSDLQDFKRIAVRRPFEKGEMIFLEGDPGNGFYVIAEGMIKVFKASFGGKEQILHVLGPGEPFGEVAVFAGQPFPANAMALAKSSLLFFPREAFVERITKNPSLAMNMLAVLSVRLKQFTNQIESLALKEVPARLAGYLLYLSEEQQNKDRVKLNISKGSLASFLGTIPETLSRIFAKMSDQGLIEVSGKDIRLMKYEGIEELFQGGKIEL